MSHKMPAWLNQAIFYEVYPQSFFDSNADGIGDLQGIICKLDYITSLGCNAIWMNPCFDSPFMDAGYDVRDYYTVAPRYGTNEDLEQLFSEAHKRNLHVILDLVPGHTSYQHPWFQASMQAEKNLFSDRYVWTDNCFGPPPEGFQTLRGISDRNGSAIVNFFSTQPALNYGFYRPDQKEAWQQPMSAEGPMATRAELLQIMKFWLGLGCDGFRVDMAGSLVKNDPDSLGTISLWQDIRLALDAFYPDAVLISEWGEPEKSIAAGFDLDFLLHFGPSHYTDLYHCDTPYFSTEGDGTADAFVEKYKQLYHETAGHGMIGIISGNHDMERMSHYLNDVQQRLAFTFLLTMPGVPFIYYGDELGMKYQGNLNSKEGGYFRTGSRTPMQWSASPNAGFSSAAPNKLYLPVDSEDITANVAYQTTNLHTLYQEVRNLILLRTQHTALQNPAAVRFLSSSVPMVYERISDTERITVVLNPSSTDVQYSAHVSSILYETGNPCRYTGHNVVVPAESAVVFL